MQTDSFFYIGKSHTVCEDYALHGKNCIILSDGCSSSKYSDIGSRLLCITANRILNSFISVPFSYDEFGKKVAVCVSEQLRLLDLPMTTMDATLMVAFEFKGLLYLYTYGDGYYQIKFKNKHIQFGTVKFNRNAPYYLSYWLSPQNNIDYIKKYGNGVELITGTYINGTCEMNSEIVDLSFSHDKPLINFPIPIDQVEYIMLMSDGVESFQNYSALPTIPIKPSDIIEELSCFKNKNGQFITRRVKAALKQFRKDGIEHFDDLSVAGMYID